MPFLDYSRLGMSIPTNSQDEIRFNCIFCEDEHYHLYVNIKKRVYVCHKCNTSGKHNIVVADMNRVLFNELEKHQKDIPVKLLKLPKAYKDYLTPAAKRYLASRDIYESDIRRHKIYCAAPFTFYFGRLIIPCNARAGWCSYFVARAYTKIRFPKYLNPSYSRTNVFLSPEEPADERWSKLWDFNELMLVEGPFDYLKASRHGPTVALLGKQLSNEQAKFIVSVFDKVYIMLDQGIPESLAAIKIRDMLASHVDVEILNCPKKDPGECNEEDFQEAFR